MAHSQAPTAAADVLRLIELFSYICSDLTQDEILYWARKEKESIRQIIDTPSYTKFDPADFPSRPWPVKIAGVDAHPHVTMLVLIESFCCACKELEPDQIEFWCGAEPLLRSIFAIGEVEFLKKTPGSCAVAAQPAGSLRLLNAPPFRRDQNRFCFLTEECSMSHPATGERMLAVQHLESTLSGCEILASLGLAEKDLSVIAFTPQQLHYLAKKQRKGNSPGPLSFSDSNYFPCKGKDGSLRIWSLIWCSEVSGLEWQHKYSDKWIAWSLAGNHLLGEGGRFCVFE